MAQITLSSRALLRQQELHDFRIDTYTDQNGGKSLMRWIPPFRACRSLTAGGAALSPSGTVGDWFHPADLLLSSGLVADTDYTVYTMGGYWVDMYLCSSSDATAASMGTVCSSGTDAYVSQALVAPRVSQTVAHFKTYLKQRFDKGDFKGSTTATTWAGKGGLITDAHWFELWVWTRINRWLVRGNTNGYNNHPSDLPQWHDDANEIGILDGAQSAIYGASVTGGGPESWNVPVSDFCGNRWEFTDGLRLYDGEIYTAGKTINPDAPTFPDTYTGYTKTNLTAAATGVTSGQSISKYREEAAIALHGFPETTTTAGTGPMDGQGFWYEDASAEHIAMRGGSSRDGAQAPGALGIDMAPSIALWLFGGRAVLVP